jgi:hypothetical protein
VVVSPKTKLQLAREHPDRALPAVESNDYTEAVTWLFVSLEAAIVALAEQHGVPIEPNHWRKVKAAEQLYARGAITTNFAPALRTLNEARKEAVYDGEDPDFGDQSLEDLASEVESAVDLAGGS